MPVRTTPGRRLAKPTAPASRCWSQDPASPRASAASAQPGLDVAAIDEVAAISTRQLASKLPPPLAREGSGGGQAKRRTTRRVGASALTPALSRKRARGKSEPRCLYQGL